MRQSADRLSFRWFLGYDIDEPLPTHSAISKNLARFGPDLFQELFDETVRMCVRNRLVGGKLVHVDSSTIKANAAEDSVVLKQEEGQFHPDLAPHEYWNRVKKEAKCAHPNVNDRMESTTDPDADIISRDGKGRQLAYKDHRAVDDKHGVVIATQATGAAVTDHAQFQSVVNEVIFRQHVIAEGVAADRIYGTNDNYKYLVGLGIQPTIPRKRSARKEGRFGKEMFHYNRLQDRYICPAGEELRPQGRTSGNAVLYRASSRSCATCTLRDKCVSGKKHPRTISIVILKKTSWNARWKTGIHPPSDDEWPGGWLLSKAASASPRNNTVIAVPAGAVNGRCRCNAILSPAYRTSRNC